MMKTNQYRLKSIRVEGFQPFLDSTFELGDVTVISGFSDSGKSALVRAFYSLVSGGTKQEQIKSGESAASVTVVREDGRVLISERIDGHSPTFTIDGIQLSKLGARTPDEVFAFLGWEPIKVDKDVSLFPFISRQHDAPFLLSSPPSQMAKAFAKMSGAHILHAAIRLAVSKEQAASRDADFHTRSMVSLTDDLEQFANLPTKKILLKDIEQIYTLLEKQELLKESLKALIVKRDTFASSKQAEDKLSERVNVLGNLLSILEDLFYKQSLLRAASVKLPDFSDVDNLTVELDTSIVKYERLFALSSSVFLLKKEYNGKAAEGRSVMTELDTVEAELDKFEVCPTCGRVIE